MSEAIPSETDINTNPKFDIDENENENDSEVKDIFESNQEAQYFDPSSMATLNPTSMVSIQSIVHPTRTSLKKIPGSDSPFKSIQSTSILRMGSSTLKQTSGRSGLAIRRPPRRSSGIPSLQVPNAHIDLTRTGQAAFPGGKADTLEETPWETARREAFEEIGLPLDDSKIPPPFRIEHLCQLPNHFAKTALAVRPCIAFLHSDDIKAASVGDSMIPRLDAKEVAAVFSAPFHNFLKPKDEVRDGDKVPGQVTDWYSGRWVDWHDRKWRLHNFHVPVNNQKVSKPKVRQGGQAAIAEELDREEDDGLARYKVWGMTARMVVDAARVAYGEEPTFPVRSSINRKPYKRQRIDTMQYNENLGDEPIIEMLEKTGKLGEKVPGQPDLAESNTETSKATETAKVSASKM
ncbi:Peroxisomal coenzyme A diphosphatase 1,peroxisomal [Lachnellula subtilissima]|uniref:Peroxisomal coenzyme A diphosphatase 1,peroxisomal n=1 Tax=Lachnellula subtilissima TaxID=602034 RepID=A0A8H8U968_9HELO|nr:Peroxisomal coenzyme A diphosphatase 1,peroxisomal [Lachnellula subtilissima]